jgi:hypothetical protein
MFWCVEDLRPTKRSLELTDEGRLRLEMVSPSLTQEMMQGAGDSQTGGGLGTYAEQPTF